MSTVGRLLVPLAVLLASLSPGQTSTPGKTVVPKDPFELVAEIKVSGVTATQNKVSGTNVTVLVDTPSRLNTASSHVNDYTGLDVTASTLKIGGTTVRTYPESGGSTGTSGSTGTTGTTGTGGTGDPGDPTGPEPFLLAARPHGPIVTPQPQQAETWVSRGPDSYIGRGARFASTHFSDGQSITIEYKVTYKAYKNGIVQWTEDVTATLVVVAYNKLQTLGTGVDETGIGRLLFQTASDKTTGAATTLLASSHTASPGATARTETKTNILDKSAVNTVVSAMTHGDLSGIFQSIATPNASPTDLSTFVFFSQIKSTVESRTPPVGSIPPFNMVGYWACRTIDPDNPDNSPSVKAYKSVGFIDRAYLGFDDAVSLDIYSFTAWNNYDPDDPDDEIGSPDYDLGDHANLFWFLIHQGDTAEDAVDLANAAYPPTNYDSSDRPGKLAMLWLGDPRSNLINVYLTQSEYNALVASSKPTSIWWIKS